ncbi:N-6 DNA methylase [Candidatus Bathyarchaeota archaeon]|nr:N-6 DNA methylase [Candidatus Bathyarchaeota archaeon]
MNEDDEFVHAHTPDANLSVESMIADAIMEKAGIGMDVAFLTKVLVKLGWDAERELVVRGPRPHLPGWIEVHLNWLPMFYLVSKAKMTEATLGTDPGMISREAWIHGCPAIIILDFEGFQLIFPELWELTGDRHLNCLSAGPSHASHPFRKLGLEDISLISRDGVIDGSLLGMIAKVESASSKIEKITLEMFLKVKIEQAAAMPLDYLETRGIDAMNLGSFLHLLLFMREINERERLPGDLAKVIQSNEAKEYSSRAPFPRNQEVRKIFLDLMNDFGFLDGSTSETFEGYQDFLHFIDSLPKNYPLAESFDLSSIKMDIHGFLHEVLVDEARKQALGLYYTPDFLVHYMISRAFDEWLNHPRCGKTRRRHRDHGYTILDPACGTGSFLRKFLDFIHDHGGKQRDCHIPAIAPLAELQLVGVDVDRRAVAIAKTSLHLHALHLEGKIDRVDIMIDAQNFIKSNNLPNAESIDAVVANPPYIPWKYIPAPQREALADGNFLGFEHDARCNHPDAQPNLYLFFLVKVMAQLRPGGIACFLLPQEWLHHEKALPFRNYILESCEKIELITFNPDINMFQSMQATISTNSLILLAWKAGMEDDIVVPERQAGIGNGIEKGTIVHHHVDATNLDEISLTLASGKFHRSLVMATSDLVDRPWKFLPTWHQEFKKHVMALPAMHLDDPNLFLVRGGFQPPIHLAKCFEITQDEFLSLPIKERQACLRIVLDASEIQRYVLVPSQKRYWIVANDYQSERTFKQACPTLHGILKERVDHEENDWWKFPNVRNLHLLRQSPVKILCPRTASCPTFALDKSKHAFKGTNTMIISREIPHEVLVGILNSKLSEYWFRAHGAKYHGGDARKYEPSKLKATAPPIIIGTREQQLQISRLVSEITSLLSIDSGGDDLGGSEVGLGEVQLEQLEQCLDALVFDIYDVPPRCRSLILRFLEG